MRYLKEKINNHFLFSLQKILDKPQKKINSMMWLSLDSYQWVGTFIDPHQILHPLSVSTLRWRILSAICTPLRQEKIQFHVQEGNMVQWPQDPCIPSCPPSPLPLLHMYCTVPARVCCLPCSWLNCSNNFYCLCEEIF